MAEQILIDANVLKMDLPTETPEDECITEAVCKIIDKQPTVDAVPVVHGHWEKQSDNTHFCSNCGVDAPYDYESVERPSFYCPHCGAKMDGERSSE